MLDILKLFCAIFERKFPSKRLWCLSRIQTIWHMMEAPIQPHLNFNDLMHWRGQNCSAAVCGACKKVCHMWNEPLIRQFLLLSFMVHDKKPVRLC